VNAAVSGTNFINGVDYLMQGTIVDKPLRDGVATNNSMFTYLPTWTGKYENQKFLINDWYLYSWSQWATTNNRNNDYYTERGDSIIEYDVESKTQYQYKVWNPEQGVEIGKMYVTTYKGNRWYNSFITKTKESEISYPGSIDNYNITGHSTYYFEKGHIGGYVNDYTWHDSAPTGNDLVLNTRTVYRYRARTITWNPTYSGSAETTPLKYSLYDTDGNPYEGVVKWSFASIISEHKNISVNSYSDLLAVNQYYFTAYEVIRMFEQDLELLENTYQIDVKDVIAYVAGYIADATFLAALPTTAQLALASLLTIIGAYDYAQIMNRQDEFNSMQDFFYYVESNNKTIVLTVSNLYTFSTSGNNLFGDIEYITTDKNYISMNYSENDGRSGFLSTSEDNYGFVYYGVSSTEITNNIYDAMMGEYPTIFAS